MVGASEGIIRIDSHLKNRKNILLLLISLVLACLNLTNYLVFRQLTTALRQFWNTFDAPVSFWCLWFLKYVFQSVTHLSLVMGNSL